MWSPLLPGLDKEFYGRESESVAVFGGLAVVEYGPVRAWRSPEQDGIYGVPALFRHNGFRRSRSLNFDRVISSHRKGVVSNVVLPPPLPPPDL